MELLSDRDLGSDETTVSQLIEQGYFGDKTQAALAEEFDLPLGTVKSRQRLALARLRRHLDPVL